MKHHTLYLLAILLSSVGFYTLGQYVGLYKMQAHVVVLDQLAANAPRYKYESKERQLEACEDRLKKGNLSLFPNYEWYQSHWSFSFPDVTGIDQRTESMNRQIQAR